MWKYLTNRWTKTKLVWFAVWTGSCLLTYMPKQVAGVVGASPSIISLIGNVGIIVTALGYFVRHFDQKKASSSPPANTPDPVEPDPRYKEL